MVVRLKLFNLNVPASDSDTHCYAASRDVCGARAGAAIQPADHHTGPHNNRRQQLITAVGRAQRAAQKRLNNTLSREGQQGPGAGRSKGRRHLGGPCRCRFKEGSTARARQKTRAGGALDDAAAGSGGRANNGMFCSAGSNVKAGCAQMAAQRRGSERAQRRGVNKGGGHYSAAGHRSAALAARRVHRTAAAAPPAAAAPSQRRSPRNDCFQLSAGTLRSW